MDITIHGDALVWVYILTVGPLVLALCVWAAINR